MTVQALHSAARQHGPTSEVGTGPSAVVSPDAWLRDYRRVAQAITWLDANRTAQPRLPELAAALHLSPSHLQRTFTRFAGTSPTRFLRWLTAGAARELLRERATVLETTSQLGLSSGGRLHELLVTVDAVTPGEVGRGGRGLEIRAAVHPSPLGEVLVAVTERGLLELRFLDPADLGPDTPGPDTPGADASGADAPGADASGADASGADAPGAGASGPDTAGPTAAIELLRDRWPAAELLEDAAATRPSVDHLVAVLGGTSDGPLRVAAVGTNLQLKVWEALLTIPDGRVVSYAEVARAARRPDAVRAVASAVGRNPVAALIPCHRVLRGTGELGGYRWGTVRKRALLAREAARHAG